MDRHEIIALLDKSCSDALDAWKKKYVRGERQNSQMIASVAMKELRERLRKYQKSDYDCIYVPPAYVVLYQFKHINLALRALSSLDGALEKRWGQKLGIGHRRSLRIVDFGAGTSAGRIGAALMVAKAFEDDRSIDYVYFDEIDISAPMLKMGEMVWEAFVQRVQSSEFSGEHLTRAVRTIDYKQHRDWKEVKGGDCETWLTAFHVTYRDQNRDDLKKTIRMLYQQVEPIVGAFSCHSRDGMGGNLPQLKDYFPFERHIPQHEKNADEQNADEQKCEAKYTIDQAVDYGFITREYRRNSEWNPFLSISDCAILYGGSSAYLNRQLEENTRSSSLSLVVGDRVSHATLGPGTVRSASKSGNRRTKVIFDRANYPIEISADELERI